MGLPSKPLKAIFPIVSVGEMPEPRYGFLGTGFFIDDSGLFFTAKHVCKGVENEHNAAMVDLSTDKLATPYQISNLRFSEEFDIALGEVKGVRDIEPLAIATENAPMNFDILTAEFSGTYSQQIEDERKALIFNPYFRKGQVLCYYTSTFPETVPTGCLQLSFPALKGASGAPVIVENTGSVIGMIVGNIEHELLPAQIERVTNGHKYVEEVKYLLPSAKAISWKHLNDLLKEALNR